VGGPTAGKQDKPPQDEAARWNRYPSDDPSPKPEEPSARRRSWDDVLQGRYDPPQKPDDGDWGSDLDRGPKPKKPWREGSER
jgi:hypothetical protein